MSCRVGVLVVCLLCFATMANGSRNDTIPQQTESAANVTAKAVPRFSQSKIAQKVEEKSRTKAAASVKSKGAEGDPAESPPQPPAIINVHLEEPQKDPIEEKRLAEERRAERRRIRELEDKEETDKQAFQQIINMQNNQIQQLSELAQITNKLSEEQVRGSMAQAADRVALTHQAYINALVRGIGEKSVVYNMAAPIENHLHLSTEGDNPKVLQQQQEWGGDEGGEQDGAGESSGLTSESTLPAPAARTQPASVKPCGMKFADANSIRQSQPMDAMTDADQADFAIPDTMSTDDLPDYNSPAPVTYNRTPAIATRPDEEALASEANVENSPYQPFNNEMPPYVAEGLMPGNSGDSGYFEGLGQFGGSPTDSGVAGIPAFD